MVPRTFFLIGISFLTLVVLLMIAGSGKEGFDNWPWSLPPKNGLSYLQQYEEQDFYKNNPGVWPVPFNAATASYAVRRNLENMPTAHQLI
jgi:hypothetical protein